MQWLKRLFRSNPDPIGMRGERAAAKWLKHRGYRILDRNLTLVDDEADLIALDPDGVTVVIVEVKTRRNDRNAPEFALTHAKQFNMARMAARLQRSPKYKDRPMRFDVIAVIWPDNGEPVIRHTPGAFESQI